MSSIRLPYPFSAATGRAKRWPALTSRLQATGWGNSRDTSAWHRVAMYSVILRDAGVSGNDAGACCVAVCPATGLIATSPPSSVSASASAHPPLLHLLHPHPPGWSTAVPLLPFSHAPLVALRWTPPQCGRRALVAVTADGTVAVVTGGAGGSACGAWCAAVAGRRRRSRVRNGGGASGRRRAGTAVRLLRQ